MDTSKKKGGLTPFGKIVIVVLLGVAGFFAIRHFWPGGKKPAVAPSVPPKAELPAGVTPGTPSSVPPKAVVPTVALPTSTKPGCARVPEMSGLLWAWQSQNGLLFSNGGPQSVEGSLMCQNGVNLKLARQDMVPDMTAALVACAAELGQGKSDCSNGAHFIAIMGDGAAAYFAGAQPEVSRVCSDCKLEIIGSAGYSRGEDKFMGPPEWKQNSEAARGGLVAGVVRDGDWNIAINWAGDNGICNNPNEQTYDPNCLNWVNTPGYIEAAQAYIAGVCEERTFLANGFDADGRPVKKGSKGKVCVDSAVTWTPGDVDIATKRGGLVSIRSTAAESNLFQMPNVIIGISKWNQAHRQQVIGFLKAMTDGGQQVKQNPAAFKRATEVNVMVYGGTEDAAYWQRYFNPVVQKDVTGLPVELGGSAVNNLADNLYLFGLTDDTGTKPGVGLEKSIFAATYKTFGNIVVHYYPDLVPSYPPVTQVVNTSYLEAVQAMAPAVVQADLPTYAPSSPADTEKPAIGRLDWSIQFKTGSADFDAAAFPVLDELYRRTVINSAKIEIVGHTDDVGNDGANVTLSIARAQAVKRYLQSLNPQAYPDNRFPMVTGRGEAMPVDPAKTPTARAKNRRVEIVMREN